MELIKRQLHDGFKINRQLESEGQKMKDEYRALALVRAR